MSDNVIILGAGFSFDAGIPLLSGFIDRMKDMAVRGTIRGERLSPDDRALIQEAMDVRAELDNYHGRAVFDDRNIEDILSVLAFNVLGGGKNDQNKFNVMSRAIARTIELTCTIADPRTSDGGARAISDSPTLYREFWVALFKYVGLGNELPPIITLNYDLVLETSLLQVLNNKIFNQYDKPLPFNRIGIHYSHPFGLDQALDVSQVSYGPNRSTLGTRTQPINADERLHDYLKVDLLKLHGSLNFPKNKPKLPFSLGFARSVSDPGILPPVSNKLSVKTADAIWRAALLKLRTARNIVVCGYSLPKTDIYMQYFLKAALGPNRDLDKITIFDPAIFDPNSMAGSDIRERYEMCFSENMRRRINFTPSGWESEPKFRGTTKHFVDKLKDDPREIFF